jgi:hypothetical protein
MSASGYASQAGSSKGCTDRMTFSSSTSWRIAREKKKDVRQVPTIRSADGRWSITPPLTTAHLSLAAVHLETALAVLLEHVPLANHWWLGSCNSRVKVRFCAREKSRDVVPGFEASVANQLPTPGL